MLLTRTVIAYANPLSELKKVNLMVATQIIMRIKEMENFKTLTELDAFADRKIAEIFDAKYTELEKNLYRLGLTTGYLQAVRDVTATLQPEPQTEGEKK